MTAEDRDTLGNTPRQTGLYRTDVTVIDVDVTSCPIIEENMRKGKGFLSDKMLYNIGLDAASTDLVCVSPHDVVFKLSDAAVFEGQLAVAETEEIRKTGEEEKEKIREKEGGEERKEEVRVPKAIIIPVYYASASARTHIHKKNSSSSSSMISDALAGGRHVGGRMASTHPESSSPSNTDVQSATVTVTAVSAAHHGYEDHIPFPFPSLSTPCGDQQSSKLLKAYIGTSDGHRIDDVSRVPFNAQVGVNYRSLGGFFSSFLLFIPTLKHFIEEHHLPLILCFVYHPL